MDTASSSDGATIAFDRLGTARLSPVRARMPVVTIPGADPMTSPASPRPPGRPAAIPEYPAGLYQEAAKRAVRKQEEQP
jgi:hypothetical protein